MSTEVAVPELTPQQQALAAFDEKEEELRELAAGSATITAITNGDGYQQCHAARMVLKNRRIEIDKHGKEVRDKAVKFSKAVILQADKFIALIEPEETRLEKLQKTWDDAREAERLEAIRVEEKRVKDLQDRVNELSGALGVAKRYNLTAAQFAEHISDLEKVPVDDTFQEFKAGAETAKAETLATLREMHATADAREKEAAKLKADREELDRQRAEQKKIDDAAKAERDAETARQNEELRKQKAAQDAEAALIAAANAAEAKRLADLQAQIERKQEEFRKAQEPPPAPPTPAPAPVMRRGVAVPVPKAEEIIEVLSKHYRAKPDTIIDWLRAIDWKQAEAA